MLNKIYLHISILVFSLTCFPATSDGQIVFPGDADNNGIVDHLDLLNIAYAYGISGPARIDSIETNIPTQALLWDNYFPGGLNYSYADCDGNGIIDWNDLILVYYNYGTTNEFGSEEDAFTSGIENIHPSFYFDEQSLPSFITQGYELQIPIYLGSEDIPLTDLTGIGFSIESNSDFFQELTFELNTNSWLFPDGNTLYLQEQNESDSKIDVSIGRTKEAALSGYGPIGYLNAVIEIDVIALLPADQDSIVAPIEITNIVAKNHDFWNLPIANQTLEIMIYHPDAIPTSTKSPIADQKIKIFPNPAKDDISVKCSEKIETISIIDLKGATVYENTDVHSKEENINIYGLVPRGVYFIKILSDKGLSIEKLIIE